MSSSVKMPLKICGLGTHFPERVVTSAEIEAAHDLESGWIESKTGIRERRWVSEGENAITMGALAARRAVEDAGMELSDIDLILWASGSPPQAIPDGAHLLQRELGIGSIGTPACMGVHATCMSFLAALDVASSFLTAGRYERILIVSADVASRGFDSTDPRSFVLFGDAAAAAVVTRPPEGEDRGVIMTRFESYGDEADLATIRGWGTTRPPTDDATTYKDNVFLMDGPGVFLAVREKIMPFLVPFYAALPDPTDVPLIVPHQPSMHALRGFRRAGIPDDKLVVTLDRYGNCVAVSIPLTLKEAVDTGRLQRGDTFFMLGFGAGLCLGGMLLKY